MVWQGCAQDSVLQTRARVVSSRTFVWLHCQERNGDCFGRSSCRHVHDSIQRAQRRILLDRVSTWEKGENIFISFFRPLSRYVTQDTSGGSGAVPMVRHYLVSSEDITQRKSLADFIGDSPALTHFLRFIPQSGFSLVASPSFHIAYDEESLVCFVLLF
jgi:hypothetical protein